MEKTLKNEYKLKLEILIEEIKKPSIQTLAQGDNGLKRRSLYTKKNDTEMKDSHVN